MGAPKLELDWELGLFKALRALWRAVVPAPPPAFDAGRAALLEAYEPALRVLAQLVAEEPVRLQVARAEGGVRGRDLLVLPWMDLAPDPEANRGLLVLRVALAAEIRRMRLPVPLDDCDNLLASLRAAGMAAERLSSQLPRFHDAWREACTLALVGRPDVQSLRGRARLIECLRQDLLRGCQPWEEPGLADRLRALPVQGPESPPVPLWGRLVVADIEAGEGSEAAEPGKQGESPTEVTTELEARPVEELKLVQQKPEEAMQLPVHAFEKVEMAEAFNGTMRQLDGEDELEEQLEALKEVDMSHLIRGGPDAGSVYKAEVGLDIDVPDISRIRPGEEAVLYDEWDLRTGSYRKSWCQVYPTTMPRGDGAWATEALSRHRRLVDQLHRELANHRAALKPSPRQADGEEVDLDALVDAWSDLHARHTPSDRLYIRKQRQERDVATTVLLDLSLSTDSWVQERRVLDVAREAVLVLGEVADRLGDRLQVLAFASHTRNQVRVWEIRGWKEPWATGRGRLGLLEPQGYTRIGPALRHATAELRKVDAKDRVLLLVSDGKPTDHDRYEGRYGVADVRQALREARRDGVHVHALAVDAVARDFLPSMLGPGGWSILPRPDRLPEAITHIYGQLS